MKLDDSAYRFFKGLLFKTGDVDYQVPRLDAITHAQNVIDYAHHEIHNGSSFSTYYTVTTAATDAHRSAIYLLTPATSPDLHMIISFSASYAAIYSICEGVTIDLNEGTNAVAIYNRDRNSTKTSGARDNATAHAANKVTTFTEAEIAGANFTAGTIIRTVPVVEGAVPKPAGGASRDTQEYILKRGTPYVFLLTNVGANANVHHILLDWYELTPREA